MARSKAPGKTMAFYLTAEACEDLETIANFLSAATKSANVRFALRQVANAIRKDPFANILREESTEYKVE